MPGNSDPHRTFAAGLSSRQKSPLRHRSAGARLRWLPRQTLAWRVTRNTALVILFWFALLGVCLLGYQYYFRFSN
jgi:hypothetical protein